MKKVISFEAKLLREWQNIFINKSTLWININGFITFRTVCWNYIFKIHWAARSGCELYLNGNQVPGKNLWTVTLAMFNIRFLLHDLCSNINGGSPTHFLNGSRGERKKTAAVNYLLHIFIDFSANRSLEWSFFFKRRVNKCNTINWSVWVDAFLLKTKYWHSILVLQNLYSL